MRIRFLGSTQSLCSFVSLGMTKTNKNMKAKGGYVYIATNKSKTLYIGVTNDLERRMWEHNQGIGSKFTAKYNITRLVYYETFDDIRDAIAREKQLKRWRRRKKVWLIERENSGWSDLSADWFEP